MRGQWIANLPALPYLEMDFLMEIRGQGYSGKMDHGHLPG